MRWTPMVPGKSWGTYFEPLALGESAEGEFATLHDERIANDTLLVHLVPEFFDHWRAAEPGKTAIGVTTWESERLPDHWVPILNRMDGLIVPSHWNREAFLRCGVERPIHVAPHIYSRPQEAAAPWESEFTREGDYLFYTIGSWSDRKGTAQVVESFCEAFTSRDAVALVVKTQAVNELRRRWGHWWWHVTRRLDSSRQAMEKIRRRFDDPPRIVLIADEMSEAAMDGLHERADCFVSLSRAEGWGLGAYEAAFHGKPVIMTRNGGQVEFLPPELSYAVPYEMVTARPQGAIDRVAFLHRQCWAEPDRKAAAATLRYVNEHRDEASARGARLRDFVEARFRAEEICRGILQFIDEVKGGHQ